MKLEQQVTSRELSEKLRDLGVKQESIFYWTHFTGNGDGYFFAYGTEDIEYGEKCNGYPSIGDYIPVHTSPEKGNIAIRYKMCSAFTVAELGEMLPVRDYITEGIILDRDKLASWSTFKSDGKWYCNLTWRYSDTKVEQIKADTEAEARGLMLEYLITNKLITI